MIVDCFTFNNEYETLELRLELLNEVVDKFILVESSYTQCLNPKPLYFEINKEKFKKFWSKILHVKVQSLPEIKGPWTFENYQRSCIGVGLFSLKPQDDDIILISDLDEIPKPEVVRSLKDIKEETSIGLKYVVYKWNLAVKNLEWIGTVANPWGLIKNRDTHDIRAQKDFVKNIIHDGGWHFGYQGGCQAVYQKYFSTIEPFDKSRIPSYTDFKRIFEDRAKNGGHFIYCDQLDRKDLSLETVPKELLPEILHERLD